MTLFKVVVCAAWVSLLVSSAAPANAIALSGTPNATYGACSGSYSSMFFNGCVTTIYRQQIHFLNVACNTSHCAKASEVYVDTIYSTGRKPVTQVEQCGSSWYIYQLGNCAC